MPFAARRTSTGRDVCGVSDGGWLRGVRRVGCFGIRTLLHPALV